MGIGVNNFLKVAQSTLSALSIKSFKVVVIDGDVYLNKKMGILFYKPVSWGFVHVREFNKLKKEQFLREEWEEYKDEIWEEYKDEIWEYIGSPICVITKNFC